MQLAPASPTLASLLTSGMPATAHTVQLRRLHRAALAPLVAAGLLVAAWCAWAPLAGAVVATGRVKPELDRKTVQHQEGGIVRELLVREGQRVKRGDPLLVVGDLRGESQLQLLHGQLEAARAQAARAAAELRFESRFEAEPTPAAQRERQLFEARQRTLAEQTSALAMQIEQTQSRAGSLALQIGSGEQAARLADEELAINVRLADEGFVQRTRVLGLKRVSADYGARVDAARGELAEARGQAAGLRNALAQARGAYQARAADELRDATRRAEEIEQQLRPSSDQVERQTVRAPVDGAVMLLRVKALGAVVGPREPLLDLAPEQEALVVEAHIDPHDIEHVRVGGEAQVRLSAFDARETAPLPGHVRFVSADAVTASDGSASFVAHVEVAAAELARHPGLSLQSGMPAEVQVSTPPRSLFEYLARPLGAFGRRALREP